MKKQICLLLLPLFLTACGVSEPVPEPAAEPSVSLELQEPASLPEKPDPSSELAADSPIDARNIDDYLFLPDVYYVDLRSPEQLFSEGAIGGFVNIPFYDVIVSWNFQDNVLFTMAKSSEEKDTYLGGVGTFHPNYEESEELLYDMIPDDRPVVFMSTAGVEAAYMINLLKQYNYDPALLYNAGTFTNGMGNTAAYRDLETHRYYIAPYAPLRASLSFDWGELHRVQ